MQIYILFLFLTLALCGNPNLPSHTLPIYGNASMGYYYVKIFVGHPPQAQSVIIDTGSGQLALPCNKCTSCNPKHIDTPFDMSKSKTAEYVTCVIILSNFSNPAILNATDVHQKTPHNHANFSYPMHRAVPYRG